MVTSSKNEELRTVCRFRDWNTFHLFNKGWCNLNLRIWIAHYGRERWIYHGLLNYCTHKLAVAENIRMLHRCRNPHIIQEKSMHSQEYTFIQYKVEESLTRSSLRRRCYESGSKSSRPDRDGPSAIKWLWYFSSIIIYMVCCECVLTFSEKMNRIEVRAIMKYFVLEGLIPADIKKG